MKASVSSLIGHINADFSSFIVNIHIMLSFTVPVQQKLVNNNISIVDIKISLCEKMYVLIDFSTYLQ